MQCRAGHYANSETAATEPSPDRDQRPSASTSFVTSVSIASAPNIAQNDWDSCMNRPYTAHSPYSLSPTEQIPSQRDDGETVDLDDDHHDDHEDPDDYDDYAEIEEYYEPIDRRWIWVAGVAGAILLVAVICTVVILGGGDSGSVSTTVAPPVTTSQPAPTTARPAATTPSAPPPAAPLTPETVTTVTPTASAPPTAAPTVAAPAPAPSTITYRVTGSRNLIDLV